LTCLDLGESLKPALVGESLEVRGGDFLGTTLSPLSLFSGFAMGYLCFRGDLLDIILLFLIGESALLRLTVDGLVAISALAAMRADDFLFSALAVRER